MKNAIILHGTGCNPKSFWQPNIKKHLERKAYSVWVPQLPGTDSPDIKKQLPFVLNGGKFTKDTIIIGHSAGCPLTLAVLENINVKVYKVILVAGYARPTKFTPPPGMKVGKDLILQSKYDWNKIKKNVKDLIYINSDNDPWGCNDKEGLYMWKKTGGTLIVREGEGHMGSDSFNQSYSKFPLLEKLLDIKYSRNVIDGSDIK